MTPFHITASGQARPCTAQTRACPYGADEHFDTQQEAAMAILERTLQKSWREDVETDLRQEVQAVLDGSLLDEVARSGYDFDWLDEAAEEVFRNQIAWLKQDADEALRGAVADEDLADAHLASAHVYSEIGAALEQIASRHGFMRAADDTDEIGQGRGRVPTAAERQRRRKEEEAVPLEWTMTLLEFRESQEAADAANTHWEQRGQLIELAQFMLPEAGNNEEFRRSGWCDKLKDVARLQTAPSGTSGRRRGGAKPIDPEFVQALRAMYVKHFGVDPFEQGVSVGELLQMMKAKLI